MALLQIRLSISTVLFVCACLQSPLLAASSVASSGGRWTQIGCGRVRASGDREVPVLGAAMYRVQQATRSLTLLFPSAQLAEPQLDIVVKCGETRKQRSAFYEGRARSFIVVGCDPQEPDQQTLEAVLRQTIEQSFERPPLWLTVGVARYIAAGKKSGEVVEVGRPTAEDLVFLRRPWLPARAVLGATKASPEWTDASLRPRFIAQAGLYIAFWASRHPGGDLSGIVLRRTELGPETALARSLGSDVDVFASNAERYFREGAFVRREVTDGDARTVGCRRPMSAQEETALSVHLLIHERRFAEGIALARRFLATEPESPSTRAALARALREQGSRSEAIQQCARAMDGGGLTEIDSYHCAAVRLWPALETADLGEVEREDVEAAAQIVANVDPDSSAEGYFLDGLARLGSGDAGGAASSGQEAFARWPKHAFALLIARAYIELEYFASAAVILRDLAAVGDGNAVRSAAEGLLARLPLELRDSAREIPVLRQISSGERVVTGRLVGIDCEDVWTKVRVSVDDRVHSYALTRLDLLDVRNYRPSTPDPVRCGERRSPEIVRLTWRKEASLPEGASGIAAALEFIPEIAKQ